MEPLTPNALQEQMLALTRKEMEEIDQGDKTLMNVVFSRRSGQGLTHFMHILRNRGYGVTEGIQCESPLSEMTALYHYFSDTAINRFDESKVIIFNEFNMRKFATWRHVLLELKRGSAKATLNNSSVEFKVPVIWIYTNEKPIASEDYNGWIASDGKLTAM